MYSHHVNRDTHTADDEVLTPGGPKPRSKVFKITPNHLQDVRKDANEISASDQPAADTTNNPTPEDPGGWKAYTAWIPEIPDGEINLFEAEYQVPADPRRDNGQTIYLFIGLQNSKFILQPVLQWGRSFAGGGPHWSIAHWYTDGTTTNTYCTTAVPVGDKTTIKVRLALTDKQGRSFDYSSSFLDFPEQDFKQCGVIELVRVFVTLEAYGINDPATDYPEDISIRFGNLNLQINKVGRQPVWAALPLPLDRPGAQAVPGRSGDFVDVFFRGVPSQE